MKKLFGTPKKAIVSVVCIIAAIAVVSAAAVKSALITKAEAKAVALGDAGLEEAEVSALRARLEFDDGRFQYEVDFYSNGTEYEYLIQARDGGIIARDIEGGTNGGNGQNLPPNAGNQSAAEENRTGRQQEDAGNQPAEGGSRTAQQQEDSLEEAKAAALMDAGLSETEVTFKKTKLDYDDGMQVYDIAFYTSDAEYDYKINASDWRVLDKSVEMFQIRANLSDGTGSNYIGVDRAKEIALNHANLNETDVFFTKAKLENDDGGVEYEIEFYLDRTEYDYTIDAVSGNIIEYEVDYD